MVTRVSQLITAKGQRFARDLAKAAPDRVRFYANETEWLLMIRPTSASAEAALERGLGTATLEQAVRLVQTYAAKVQEAKDLRSRIADVQKLVDAERAQLDQVKAESAKLGKEYASLKQQVVRQLAIHDQLKARHAAAVERDKKNLMVLEDDGTIRAASEN